MSERCGQARSIQNRLSIDFNEVPKPLADSGDADSATFIASDEGAPL